MKFVQFADLHLDSPIGGALNLPEEKKAVLRADIRTAATRAFELAREHGADVILAPGDLFDNENLQSDTAAFLADLFREAAPARVFIAPGNHDSLRAGSPYLPRLGTAWPENVHIFCSPEFETVALDDLDCAITGIGHAHRGITDRLLSRRLERARHAVNILLFHGSRDGYRPSEKEGVIPFSDDDLLKQGFTYTAIGHYHSFSTIEDGVCVRAAYSGCAQGRGLDETGGKCVLLGEIDADLRVTLQQVEVAPRRIVGVEVNVTGAGSGATVMDRIDAGIDAAQARACDIVSVSLIGALSPSIELDTSALESSNRHFHISVNRSRLQPDYDLEALARESAASPLRSAFVRRMMDLRGQAATPEEEKLLGDATYYGLYALDGRKPDPRDAD